jgi:prepilin-type N-terminal cleavage/methylation domain-containing protein
MVRQGTGHGGFTLLEMLVVLAVIALGTALIAPRFVQPIRHPRPELVLFLEGQRSQAIEKGTEVRVYQSVGILKSDPLGGQMALPKGARLEIRWPAPSVYQDRQLVAVFYPDGTSMVSDFDLVFEGPAGSRGQRVHVGISPMQGEVIYGS